MVDKRREAWEQRMRELYATFQQREARHRRIRGTFGSFALEVLASTVGSVLAVLLVVLGGAAIGVIRGLSSGALAIMATIAGGLASAIGLGIFTGPPELRELHQLWELGKREGWIQEDPDQPKET
jgi:hypothetical protein